MTIRYTNSLLLSFSLSLLSFLLHLSVLMNDLRSIKKLNTDPRPEFFCLVVRFLCPVDCRPGGTSWRTTQIPSSLCRTLSAELAAENSVDTVTIFIVTNARRELQLFSSTAHIWIPTSCNAREQYICTYILHIFESVATNFLVNAVSCRNIWCNVYDLSSMYSICLSVMFGCVCVIVLWTSLPDTNKFDWLTDYLIFVYESSVICIWWTNRLKHWIYETKNTESGFCRLFVGSGRTRRCRTFSRTSPVSSTPPTLVMVSRPKLPAAHPRPWRRRLASLAKCHLCSTFGRHHRMSDFQMLVPWTTATTLSLWMSRLHSLCLPSVPSTWSIITESGEKYIWFSVLTLPAHTANRLLVS